MVQAPRYLDRGNHVILAFSIFNLKQCIKNLKRRVASLEQNPTEITKYKNLIII